jgi:hypothetical protein
MVSTSHLLSWAVDFGHPAAAEFHCRAIDDGADPK